MSNITLLNCDCMEYIRDKAEELRGTCETFDTSSLNQAQCEALDSIVMLCEQCGWWVDSDDINEDGVCDECAEESN